MILVTMRIVIRPEARNEVVKTIRSLLGPTRVQPGCVSSHLYEDVEHANALTLVEEWESQADLDWHIRSDDYRRVLAVLDLSNEPPEIRFNTVSSTAGLEAIEAARGCKGY